MKTTYHSEYLKLKSIYLKPAKNAFVSDVHLSEQWKGLNYLSQPDFDSAIDEYKDFIVSLDETEINYFPFDDTVEIDSIYCRDASIATNFGMIICNMGKAGRALEPKFHQQF